MTTERPLRRLLPAEWPAWAGFVFAHNRRDDGRVRCLHADQGETGDAHATELLALQAGEAAFVVAEADDGQPLGWIGAELDAAAGRVWLRGPLTVATAAAAAVRTALIAELRAMLPAAQRFDAFPQADEAALVAAYRDTGFTVLATYHVMRADKVSPQPTPTGIAAWSPQAPGLGELLGLHERLFPDTYLRGQALAASLDADHVLFVATQSGQPAGYVYVQHKHAEQEGYVDYLGVSEAARGQGLGRALLATALRWALLERRLPCVHLTVRQQNAAALGLYRSVGFVEVAAGLQMRWQRP